MTISKNKGGGDQFLQTGRLGKRMLAAREVMQRMGQNPIENMARLAAKAEKQGDYPTALRGWAEIQTYIEPRRKPVDPVEQLEKHQRIATLEELQKIKAAILAGTAAAIPDDVPLIESQAIDAEVIENQAIDDLI